jgi:superfamily II DNA or RNA helicase
MSIKIDIDMLTETQRNMINQELKIENKTKYSMMAKWIFPHNLIGDDLYIPLAFAFTRLKLKRRPRSDFPVMNVSFEGTLREEQQVVKKEALSFLSSFGSVIISMYVGGGKTITAINIACNVKLKTLVVINKLLLIKQWEDSIRRFCPSASIQKLTASSTIDPESDFYIMNAINIPKMSSSQFSHIGLCIVDECHLIMAEGLSKALQNISPRYMIGLSATPYRPDGMDKLLTFFFGENKVIRNFFREHIVYKVSTLLKIKMEISEATSKVDWNSVLKQQSESTRRNEIIINIAKRFRDNNFLVLCKRVEQGKHILKRLQEENESVTSLIGSQQEFDRDARILVATNSKAGTGFDHPKLNALILACDLDSYYIQALGRIFRSRDTVPIVFDLVDDNPILAKHFENRLEVYKESGGVIKKLKL